MASLARRQNSTIKSGRKQDSGLGGVRTGAHSVRTVRSMALTLMDMYSVTKRIDFCYGHRLLDYDGVCRHPHGHNAVAEIEIRTDTLDARNMVVDFHW